MEETQEQNTQAANDPPVEQGGDPKLYAPWDDLDQEEQNERNRVAILALADALGTQANVAPVRELLA